MKRVISFILAILMLLSCSIVVSAAGENVEITDETVHNIDCKFNCVHTSDIFEQFSEYGITESNKTPSISNEIDEFEINQDFREILQNENPELTDEEIDYRIQELLENVVELPYSDFQEMIRNRMIQNSLVLDDEEITASSALCTSHTDSITNMYFVYDADCTRHTYYEYTCSKCGIITRTFLWSSSPNEHSWTNGGVCGKQCTRCEKPVWNSGHGPGSGHSWCTNG